MKENLDHLPKECEVCGDDIENIHRQYRSLGFCERHWCENADALWEEFCMTRRFILWWWRSYKRTTICL